MANVLGDRRYYFYIDDAGENFKYQTDRGLGVAAGSIENDDFPTLPRRFRPRGVYVEGTVGGVAGAGGRRVRKFLIIADPDNPIYRSNVPVSVDIEGTQFTTTGRRGERLSYGVNR